MPALMYDSSSEQDNTEMIVVHRDAHEALKGRHNRRDHGNGWQRAAPRRDGWNTKITWHGSGKSSTEDSCKTNTKMKKPMKIWRHMNKKDQSQRSHSMNTSPVGTFSHTGL
ncbi:hypothetical protein SARC_04569 [Sphaeroforma arctica JP610]|uniref:Uncharacterized protein n=1 Tax=Sphaeroforma arctica JP610 TaxID=667725 RepID=A0A0L0G4L1_9EUKA|nr:hypothetical protein SARC_04569 [Sphaeroforma arctica JP610]KNC83163.1 hypothetical protein SARC_04569 [Sphaeroforma arctica JP610]|eukprot:XP_014157065.1 hypothetical protein SARC_04569 [Sphaeroforma arctica JP610]